MFGGASSGGSGGAKDKGTKNKGALARAALSKKGDKKGRPSSEPSGEGSDSLGGVALSVSGTHAVTHASGCGASARASDADGGAAPANPFFAQ